MPIKRQTYRLDQIDDWQGPVQPSGPTREEAAQMVRDRFARMSPTERVASELTARPPTPRAAFPLRANAQTSRPMPPMAGQMFLDAGLGALEALDQPPTGMPAGMPYTTPLRLLSASGAVPSALAARAYDASGRGSVMADAPVVDPLQPADKQSMFSTAIAQRGGGRGAQIAGSVIDLFTPDFTDVATGGLSGFVPLAAMMGGLKRVNTGRKLVNGLYSRLDEAAAMIPTKGVPATGVLNWLKKAPEGISLEEVAYRKLPEWLESQGTKTVTPEMLAAHLRENPAPFPQVKTLGGNPAMELKSPGNYRVVENGDTVSIVHPDGLVRWRSASRLHPDELDELRQRWDNQPAEARRPLPEGYRVEQLRPSNAPGAQRNFTLVGPDGVGHAFYADTVFDAHNNALAILDKNTVPPQRPKFPKYQVPGGENYRETLLTLPERAVDTTGWATKEYRPGAWTVSDANGRNLGNFPEASPEAAIARAAHFEANAPERQQGRQFRSSHFPDDPNLLVHTRANERTLPTGERIRYGEEAQSDLFQTGDKIGYQGQVVLNQAERDELTYLNQLPDKVRTSDQTSRMDALFAKSQASHAGVPDLPFKDTWPDLGLKQMYWEAANDPDLAGIGFTGAKTQIERWGTERLAWEAAPGGGFKVSFEPQVGGNAAEGIDDMGAEALRRGLIKNSSETVSSVDDLKRLLGGSEVKAEKAWKRMTAQPEGGIYQPRAEGMTHFYDETGGELRNRAAKIVKPFGGTVEAGTVNAGKSDLEKMRLVYPGEADGDLLEMLRENPNRFTVKDTEPAWLSRLTPEMKAAMRERGFPLMSLAGPVAAQGIPDDPNSETDDYARLALNMGSMAALGMAAKGMAGSVPNGRSLAELSEGRIDGRTLSHLELAPASTDAMGNTLVSTRVPGGRDAIASVEPLSTGLLEVQRNPELLDKLAAKIRKYPQITAKEAARSSESIVESFIDTSRRNLEFLFKEMAPWRERSRQWYVGANKVSRLMAQEHGISPDQSSAVIAILSPQKDWHQNAEMARRLIKNYREFNASDASFTSETFNHYIKTRTKSLESTIKESLKKKKDFTLEDAATLRMELQDELRSQQGLIDRPWSELNRSERASFLRAHDEFVNGQSYPVLFPEGDIAMAAARTKAGKPSKMAWQSYAQIEKALGVLDDGSVENISRSLGNEHKVRAFFNNINRPEYGRLIGERGASTVDTHQVAGSLLQPMGASSPAVKYAMGGASDAALGLSGSNPLYQEALSRMARGTEYLPREMQSITWEGLKGLFSPSQKRNADFTVRINKLWKEYKAGRLSLERVQDAVLNEAGGIAAPEWSRRQ